MLWDYKMVPSDLTKSQKQLLKQFITWPQAPVFFLTGRTALSAFHLRHRLLENLDFFTGEEIEVESILTFLRPLPKVKELEIEKKFDRKRYFEYPDKGANLLNMKKECSGKEMANFFKGLARRLIRESIEREKF